MLLDDEAEAFRGLDVRVSARFSRFGEIAFGAVLFEQLSDHERHRQYRSLTELKVSGSVKVPLIRRSKMAPRAYWKGSLKLARDLSDRSIPPQLRRRERIFTKSIPRPVIG